MTVEPTSIRQRNRDQMQTRIREIAMRQLAEDGPAGLSMSAIAREIGVTQPALFRYVENRDSLITNLVVAAYDDFITAMSVPPELSAAEMVREQGKAMRKWALANPHHYQLIFGTPIPGYHAPKEQTREVVERLQKILILPYIGVDACDMSDFDDQFAEWGRAAGLSGWSLRHAIIGWTRLHGVLSLELAGHFTSELPEAARIYESELDILVRELEEHSRKK